MGKRESVSESRGDVKQNLLSLRSKATKKHNPSSSKHTHGRVGRWTQDASKKGRNKQAGREKDLCRFADRYSEGRSKAKWFLASSRVDVLRACVCCAERGKGTGERRALVYLPRRNSKINFTRESLVQKRHS